MSIEVMMDKERIVVPSGAVKYVIDELLAGEMNISEARQYISQQRLNERLRQDLGYVDFDNLTEDGKPTIIGEFYKNNTTFGLKLSGKWEETLKKLTPK